MAFGGKGRGLDGNGGPATGARQRGPERRGFGRRESGRRESGRRESGRRESGRRKPGRRKPGRRKPGRRKPGRRRCLPLRGKVRAAARMPSSLTPDNFPNMLSSAAKASHSPAPRQLLKHAFLRFRGRPFSARSFAQRHETISEFPCPRHRAISQPHQSAAFASPPPRQLLKHPFRRSPLSRTTLSARSFAQRHETISDFPCPRHRAISQPHQSAAFASSPPTSQAPFPPPRFSDGPSPRRHTRITKSHPESSTGSAHVPTPPCHAGHGRAASLSLASLSRVPHPRTYSKASHSPVPRQLLKHPPRRRPTSADSPSPRRHARITKSHPESSAGSAHVPTPPCHANHGRRRRFHWRPFPALLQSAAFASPPPRQLLKHAFLRFRGRPFSAQTFAQRHETISELPCPRHRAVSHHAKAPHAPAHRQLLKHPFRRSPLRGQLFSAQTYAPRHGTPLKPPWPRQGIPSPHIRGRSPAPLAKNAPTAKRGRRPAERYFRDRRLIVRLV